MRRCGELMQADGQAYRCRGLHGHDRSHTVCGDHEHRHGSTACTVFGDPEGTPGPMLGAVQGDLEGVDIARVAGGRTYQAMAFWLAGVIDRRGEDDGPSTTAKLAVELSKVMASLTKGSEGGKADDPFAEWSKGLSTPG
jgi:hypothetical protein